MGATYSWRESESCRMKCFFRMFIVCHESFVHVFVGIWSRWVDGLKKEHQWTASHRRFLVRSG